MRTQARIGLDTEETPRSISFCAHTILKPDDLFIVEDASTDPLFLSHPCVTGEPFVRFYCGAPLVVAGAAIGTLCCVDMRPLKLNDSQKAMMRSLGKLVVRLLEDRRNRVQFVAVQRLSAQLVRILMPPSLLKRYLAANVRGEVYAEEFNDVVVMFLDIAGFTQYCSEQTPDTVVQFLTSLFAELDGHIIELGLLKIKNIGDAMLVCGGLLPATDVQTMGADDDFLLAPVGDDSPTLPTTRDRAGSSVHIIRRPAGATGNASSTALEFAVRAIQTMRHCTLPPPLCLAPRRTSAYYVAQTIRRAVCRLRCAWGFIWVKWSVACSATTLCSSISSATQ